MKYNDETFKDHDVIAYVKQGFLKRSKITYPYKSRVKFSRTFQDFGSKQDVDKEVLAALQLNAFFSNHTIYLRRWFVKALDPKVLASSPIIKGKYILPETDASKISKILLERPDLQNHQ